ncbi:hypothetical protein HDU79_010303 [Rhizoclosmatium sp. JEL0117]|nr:hypothetical protein HDU79_010303 [Rhizoclosmatium sp. JEL0117]
MLDSLPTELIHQIVLCLPLDSKPWFLIFLCKQFHRSLVDETFVLQHLVKYNAFTTLDIVYDLCGLYQTIYASRLFKEDKNITWNGVVTKEALNVFNTLPSLEVLSLFMYQIEDPVYEKPIPPVLNSNSIINLRLTYCHGEIPKWTLPNLEILAITSHQSKPQPIPSHIGSHPHLKSLLISNANMTGPFPSPFFSLTSLTRLSIDRTNLCTTIPPEVSHLASLTHVDMNECNLHGPIPDFSPLQNLVQLYLRSNNLTGPIPSSIGALKNLMYLALDRNSLSGEVPVELGTIPLKTLVLEFNSELCGPLPSGFSARIGKMDGLFVDGTAIVGVTRSDGRGLNSVMDIQKLIDAGMAVNS